MIMIGHKSLSYCDLTKILSMRCGEEVLKWLTVCFLLALFLFCAYPIDAQPVERNVRVAARICPPFVMNDTCLEPQIKAAGGGS